MENKEQIQTILSEGIGELSMCWEFPEKAGEFKSEEATKILGKIYTKLEEISTLEDSTKTLHNTTASQAAENVKDIVFWGNGNTFKLIAKASSKQEKWMKSTKAMEITGIGCVIQVTTQQGDNVAEALTFVPNTRIKDIKDENGNVVSRQIVQ